MRISDKKSYWTPRILGILFILYLSLFSLDSFDSSLPTSQQILAFLIHLIPSIVLSFALVLAWKKELWGGILLLLIGIAGSNYLICGHDRSPQSSRNAWGIVLTISMPFALTGVSFILDHLRTKRDPSPPGSRQDLNE
jgi:hypothetical protein